MISLKSIIHVVIKLSIDETILKMYYVMCGLHVKLKMPVPLFSSWKRIIPKKLSEVCGLHWMIEWELSSGHFAS